MAKQVMLWIGNAHIHKIKGTGVCYLATGTAIPSVKSLGSIKRYGGNSDTEDGLGFI